MMTLLLRLMSRNFDDLRIRQKLFRINLLLLGMTAVFMVVFFPAVQRWQLEKQAHGQLEIVTRMLAQGVETGLVFGDSSAVMERLGSLEAAESIHATAVFQADGTPFAVYKRAGDDFDPSALRGALDAPLSPAEPFVVLERPGHNISVMALFSEGQPLGRVVLEQSSEDMARDILLLRAVTLFVALCGMTVGMLLFALIIRRIVRPLQELDAAARRVVEGDFSVEAQVQSRDEIGQLAETFNLMLGKIRGSMQSLEEQQAYLNRSVEVLLGAMQRFAEGDLTQHLQAEREDAIGRLTQGFNTTVGRLRELMKGLAGDGETLAGAATDLTRVSTKMLGEARASAQRAGQMAGQTQMVDQHIQSVATATEEMGASINEIARSSTDAANTAASAVQLADQANVTVDKLGESSREIGEVVKVITSIAEQTNLLALNATIEAARAGDAGRGFAVVANEVKELAKETARATEAIGSRIAVIQQDTAQAVAAIARINEAITRVSSIQTTIAGAVEEQAVTTSEINQSLTSAADGSRSIATGVDVVVQGAEGTTAGAQELQDAATRLGRISAGLTEAVRRFRI
ncbi:MAG: methyl-accepting chemotaxis protein [Candidatus Delongbacteria bacterium]